jgi:anti-anti-sigma regulatory factor
MTGRSRHGMHVVRDDLAPLPQPITGHVSPAGERDSVSLHLQSVVLAVAGRLSAHTAGRLRMFLSMFTVDGGPGELVLDLSGVSDADDDGMAPIFEAESVLSLRSATLRLTAVPAQVTRFLDGPRRDRNPDQEN